MPHETYLRPNAARRAPQGVTENPEFSAENPLAALNRGRLELTPDRAQDLNDLAEAVHSPAWQRFCRARQGHHPIPSGATYLAQLIAHDTSMTLPRAHVFEPVDGRAVNTNLIRTPLILATLYGRGPMGEQELYSGLRFRVGPGGAPSIFVQAQETGGHSWPTTSMPLVYDRRNADSPMLLCMSYAFKAFHNRMVDAPAGLSADQARALSEDERFVYARAMTVRTWHNIIRSDVIDKVCRGLTESTAENRARAVIANRDPNSVPANLSHAAFRCFHSLVLGNYRFKTGPLRQTIKNTLKPVGTGHALDRISPDAMIEWQDDWLPDWPLFFDPDAEGANVTGFSPSFVFRNQERVSIAQRDFVAGLENGASTARELLVPRDRIALLYATLDRVLGTGDRWQTWGRSNPTPVMLGLLADGFFEHGIGADGLPAAQMDSRLGPIASALVRSSVDRLLDSAAAMVTRTLTDCGLHDLAAGAVLPNTFNEMIASTKGE